MQITHLKLKLKTIFKMYKLVSPSHRDSSLIQNPFKMCSDRNGEFVYHDLKIINKHFESSSTKATI